MSHKSMRFGLFMHFRGHPLFRTHANYTVVVVDRRLISSSGTHSFTQDACKLSGSSRGPRILLVLTTHFVRKDASWIVQDASVFAERAYIPACYVLITSVHDLNERQYCVQISRRQ